MEGFLSFEKFITPIWIKIVFWIGVVVIVLSGIVSMFGASQFSTFGPIGVIVVTLITLVGWRIWCELVILAFRIYEELVAIRKNTTR